MVFYGPLFGPFGPLDPAFSGEAPAATLEMLDVALVQELFPHVAKGRFRLNIRRVPPLGEGGYLYSEV